MKKSIVAIGLLTITLVGTPVFADVLNASAGPSNNGLGAPAAIFLDLEAISGPMIVTGLTTANSAAAGAAFSVEVFTRSGTALGGPVASGPGSSTAGWTSLGTVPATQGGTASGVSLLIDIPDIALAPGSVTGVALQFTTAGPRYFGTGTGPPTTFEDANLRLVTGDARSAPFTPTGSFFTPRLMVGTIEYHAASLYGAGSATPSSVSQGCSTLLSMTAFPDPGGSTGIAVAGDLSAFGGSSAQAFTETSPGSNVFEYNLAVPINQAVGPATIVATLTDNESHTANVNIGLTVTGALLAAGAANPTLVPQGCTSDLSVNLTIPPCAGTSGHAVTADLSAIGGSGSQAFAETSPGSGVFSFTAAIPQNQSLGAVSLPASATDAQGHSANTNINLTISPAFTITGNSNPASLNAGEQSLLTIQVNVPACATSTGHTVSADLSSIGGSGTQSLFDDGPGGGHGDATAGDNIFSYLATVPLGTTAGSYAFLTNVSDAQGHSASTSLFLGVGGFFELEPNDTKATATPVSCIAAGAFIQGSSTGTTTTGTGALTSADYFRVKTCALPLGIYKNRLTITTEGTAGHTGTIRGLNQSGGVIGTTDSVAQTALTTANGDLPARTVQWFGFGKQEEIYYRVTGTTTTTEPYIATLSTIAVPPVDATLTYNPGNITIQEENVASATDMDIWVYDSQFNAIPCYGRDSPEPTTLTANFDPGTYYIATTNYNFANNQSSCPPETFLTGIVLDFPNAATCSSSTTGTAIGVSINDGVNSEGLVIAKPGAFEMVFVRFVVGGAGCACPGDMDGSTTRNGLDVSGFAAAVIAGSGACADINGDTTVTNDDISPFVTLILSGAACP